MAASPVGMKRFYTILGVVAVIGIGVLGYQLARPATVSIPANVTIQPSDTAGFRGYVKGSDSAAVEITEYADYQCPFCQTFATLQMPTIDERLIKTGRLRWRYRDFPLQQHPYSRVAAHSAACADEQGKFWPQHERIYEGQSEWAASSDAADIFRRYAGETGLDLRTYDACMSAGKYAGRIQASLDEGVRAGVSSTPTLLVGGRLYQGRFDSDAITKLVDSLAPRTTSAK
jgi:protein-disulfide isomerase